jgi:hypothetical protein
MIGAKLLQNFCSKYKRQRKISVEGKMAICRVGSSDAE